MASVVEQLASNINFSAFAKAEELKKRLWFTLGALIVYRLGTYIPIPGIDPEALNRVFQQNQSGLIGVFDAFAGGAIGRMAIFALGLVPYITASIIMQLMTTISPAMEQLKKEGEQGRKQINQYTRYGTVALCVLQGYGLAIGLEGAQTRVVLDPGFFFRFTTVISLVGGTMFLMWLGEQIARRGIGNGISLIIFSGIVAQLPSALAATLELGRQGALSTLLILSLFVMVIGVIGFIVFVERAQRRIPVQYPKRQVGNRLMSGEASHLPLKLNTAGVIPPIFASSLLLAPITALSLSGSQESAGWITDFTALIGRGQPLYLLLYSSAIAFFAFFYTAIVFNPVDTADNLKRAGGFVLGIRPGKQTADYIDRILTRLTVIGASYLVLVCLLPEILISRLAVPFYFGGTSLLIVVSVTMDTIGQVQSHLLAHQYEGLVKRARLRGKR